MTPSLPARDPGGHKGTFGTVAVVGGSAHAVGPKPTDGLHMLGGPCFAATAALRSGAGLARLVLPEPLVDAGLAIAPSATGIALAVDERGDIVGHEAARVLDRVVAEADCLVVGPGLGTRDGACACVVRAVQQERIPVVIDADALNCLALVPEVQRDFHAAAVLTPHPGEFAHHTGTCAVARAEPGPHDQTVRFGNDAVQNTGRLVA
ncbi:MAG: ADP/ATP-dependent (S)-NAD(P)H-hydrate dehydratase, partial [Planctomycetota bacterium]